MEFILLNIILLLTVGSATAQDQQPIDGSVDSFIDSSVDGSVVNTKTKTCGSVENDFAPCVNRERADLLFKQCCQQYAPEGCQSLCQYETDELSARNLVSNFNSL